jgi:hypothetical protein
MMAKFYELDPADQFDAWQFLRWMALENGHDTLWIDVLCLSEAYFRLTGDEIAGFPPDAGKEG